MTECQDFHLERRTGLPRRGQGGQERRDDTKHWMVRLSQTWRKSNDFSGSRFAIGTTARPRISSTPTPISTTLKWKPICERGPPNSARQPGKWLFLEGSW